MSDLALRVSNIGKRYELGQLGTASDFVRRTRSLARRALGRGRANGHDASRPWDHETDPNAFWALRGIDFEVREGEVLGIIGANGAGKSTLLKVLSRITAPTVGRIELFGRVASLLEVGTGFHPELTGRENVYLNGSILGMTRAEITKKFDAIVDFAGVERFIDTPVKRYSSGMKVRLGFAVAAHLEPEILIVDEVLAVGDIKFQRKCIGKMQDVATSGRTVLFVSHQMNSITQLCDRCLVIGAGEVVYEGGPDDAVQRYSQEAEGAWSQGKTLAELAHGPGTFCHSITANGTPLPGEVTVDAGDELTFEIQGDTLGHDYPSFYVMIEIKNQDGMKLAVYSSAFSELQHQAIQGRTSFSCTLPKVPFLPGQYWIDVGCYEMRRKVQHWSDLGRLNVLPGTDWPGVIPNYKKDGYLVPDSHWACKKTDENALKDDARSQLADRVLG